MKRWKLGLLAGVLFSGLALAGCGSDGGGQPSEDGDAETKKITMGYFPNLDHAPAIVGLKKDIFAKHLDGVEIKTEPFPDGNNFMDALNSGNLDIGYVGPGPAISRFMAGNDVVILASAANGATLIVAREGSGIEQVADLSGKSFCTPGIGCTHDVQLEKMMLDIGLTTNRIGGDVIHQKQPPATVEALFESEQMDAAALPEPWGTYLVETANASIIVEWDEVAWGETLPSVVLVSSKAFVEKNPELVKNFLKAHTEAIKFVNENRDDSITAINDTLYELTQKRLPESVLTKSWERMKFTSEVHSEALQEWADASYDLKFIQEPPKLDGLVDTTLIEEISK
ncbi:ABC transporter substrate-binding protein [Ammoniphilus oxalaticus]|uniref:ABC transporter substrate-binding protein n=1 Tax=Ammoniphilus oxalaticus TaxID=66863 RepID=A0A419SJJ4_9BACL|nr:aliphatic sulfonate ABC transporter substrate-binding protein [Ammoniphilus oxalaticus]RKD24130.1 ABC transporter substrate-binding protein [Ammoniphilus oxalaticus]